jgi:hypothetical protein
VVTNTKLRNQLCVCVCGGEGHSWISTIVDNANDELSTKTISKKIQLSIYDLE